MTPFERSARIRLLARRERLLDRDASQAMQVRSAAAALRPAEAEAAERQCVRAERELEEVDAALRRLVLGTYGTCDACGRALGNQRLLAEPEARLCWRCADPEDRPARRAEEVTRMKGERT